LSQTQKLALPILYALGAPLITVGIRYGTRHYDVFSLSFYRYVAGCAALVLICLASCREDLLQLLQSRRKLISVTVVTIISFVAQVLFIKGLALTSAVLGDLILLLVQPLSISFAVVLFPDERRLAQSPVFVIAAVVVFAGALGIIRSGPSLQPGYSAGIVLMICSAVGICAYNLALKRITRDASAWAVATVAACITCVLFLAGSILWGNPLGLFQEPLLTNVIIFASGVYGLIVGMGLATLLMKHLGVIVFSFATLAVPFFTGVLGYLLLGEMLTLRQAEFGLLIIAGCGLVFSRLRTNVASEAQMAQG